MNQPRLEALRFVTYDAAEMRSRAQAFCELMSRRRTVRECSDRTCPDVP